MSAPSDTISTVGSAMYASACPAAGVDQVSIEIVASEAFVRTFLAEYPQFNFGEPASRLAGKAIYIVPLPSADARLLVETFNALAELSADQPVLARTAVPLGGDHLRVTRPAASGKRGRPSAKEAPLVEALPKAWTAFLARRAAPYLRAAGIRPVVRGGREADPVDKAGVYLGCVPGGAHAAAQVRHLAAAWGLQVEPPPPPSYVVYRLLPTGEVADWAAAVAEFAEAAVRVCGATELVQWPTRAAVAVGHRHAAFERAVGAAVRGHEVARVADPTPTAAAARDRLHAACEAR